MDSRIEKELLLQSRNPFVHHNGISVVSVDENHSQAELVIREDSLNPFGSVHGGALFTLADLCSGVAARADGRHYVTDQASISYLRGASQGRLLAKGTVLHRGRSRCVVDVKIYDEQDRLLSTGTFSFFCKS